MKQAMSCHKHICPIGVTRSFAYLLSILAFEFVTLSNGFCADRPSIQAEVSAEEVFIGEPLVLQIVVANVDSSESPNLDGLNEDFDVKLEATQPMNSSSMVIVNGRVSQQTETKTIYQYRLTPKRSGNLEIPSIKMTSDGGAISTRRITLRVLEPEPQEYVFAEILTNRSEVYPTESFQVTLRILVRGLPDSSLDPLAPLSRNPPQLSIPWIEPADGLKGPDDIIKWLNTLASDRTRDYGFAINNYQSDDAFAGFFEGRSKATFDLLQGKETKELEDGTKGTFFRYEITETFQGMKPGEYTFGPAAIRGNFVTESQRRSYRVKKIAVVAKPVTVTVKEVPTPRPNGFLGGIGRFRANVTANPTKMRVGDPITLTLDISGPSEESLERVFAPDLTQVETIAKDFDFIDKSPVGRVEGRNKIFTYGVRAKNKIETIPELQFYTFDPSTETFSELRTNAISLEVSDASSLSASEIMGNRTEKSPALKANRSGIYQGTIEMYPLTDNSVSVSVWVGAAGLSWLTVVVSALFLRSRNRPVTLSTNQRLAQAKSSARQRLVEARSMLASGRVSDACMELRQSIIGIVAAERGLSGDGLTTQNVLETLASSQLDRQDLESLRRLMESIDASHYGGATQEDLMSLISQAENLVGPMILALKDQRKKRTVMNGAFLVAMAVVGFQADRGHAFEIANDQQAFLDAVQKMESASTPNDFAESATVFDELIKQGKQSGSLHFHAGNAWFLAGEYGRALRHYRIAKFYLPRDSYLQANLEQTLLVAPGRSKTIKQVRDTQITDKVLFWSEWLSHPNKIRIACSTLSIAAMPMLGWLLLRNRKFILASCLLVFVSVVMFGEAYLHSPTTFLATYGVVCEETMARKGMGAEYAPAFDQALRDGAEFEVLQRTASWTLGRFEGIGDGWIKNDHIAQ